MQGLSSLPPDPLFLILSQLDFTSLSRLCSTSKTFESICDNPKFWMFKYTQEFKEPFPTTSRNSNSQPESPKRVYLRRRLQHLDKLQKDLYLGVRTQIHDIFIAAANKDEREKMEKVYEYVVDQLFNRASREENEEDVTLTDLVQYMDGQPTGILLNINSGLNGDLFYDEEITEIDGFKLYNMVQGYDANDEEMEVIDELFLRVVKALYDYTIKTRIIDYMIDTVFKAVSLNPFDAYEYMIMSPDEQFENEAISKGRLRLPPVIPDKRMLKLSFPSVLPPPPPRAPMLSKLVAPPRLPFGFPLPKHGPARPGSFVPSNLPPAPQQQFVEKGILWWGREKQPKKTTPKAVPIPTFTEDELETHREQLYAIREALWLQGVSQHGRISQHAIRMTTDIPFDASKADVYNIIQSMIGSARNGRNEGEAQLGYLLESRIITGPGGRLFNRLSIYFWTISSGN